MNFHKNIYFSYKNSKKRLRDLYEMSFISYESLVFFKKPLSMTMLLWGVKFRDLELAVKGVTKLHDGWVTSSPRPKKFFGGLNGGKDQTWPYQHLVHIIVQLCTRKNVHLMYRFI